MLAERPEIEYQMPWSWSYRWFGVAQCGCWELNMALLEELQALGTAEPSLHLLPYGTRREMTLHLNSVNNSLEYSHTLVCHGQPMSAVSSDIEF